MTTLHVQVISGLASRMRAVLGAIDWAKRHGTGVRVWWPWRDRSEELGVFPAWFSDLFDSRCSEQRLQGPENWPKQITQVSPDSDDCRVRTCDPETFGVCHPEWPHRDWWKPSESVRACIDSVKWPTGKVVGVHIRHALAQPTTPPLPWFLNRMREIRERHNVRFFLSCDAKSIQQAVCSMFPDTIHQERTYAYDGLGIRRAAADLFLLHRCDWMIGSYNSSFSELAGWLRGGAYLPGWGREGWMPGGRYEDARTPAVGIEEALCSG